MCAICVCVYVVCIWLKKTSFIEISIKWKTIIVVGKEKYKLHFVVENIEFEWILYVVCEEEEEVEVKQHMHKSKFTYIL